MNVKSADKSVIATWTIPEGCHNQTIAYITHITRKPVAMENMTTLKRILTDGD